MEWGSLTPNEIGFGSSMFLLPVRCFLGYGRKTTNRVNTVYRLNTYPFIHMGFFHTLVNILALTPLLERFEAEHGTLTSVALFIGREYCSSGVVEW